MKKHMVRGIHKIKKGGHAGDEMWRTHRLEGVVKNRGIKPVKKKKRGE